MGETNLKITDGLFITLEGPDCAGKSTQSKLLTDRFKEAGFNVMETREPGGTRIGEELRGMLKTVRKEEVICDEAELLLFCASRAQLTRQRILPYLRDGGVVLCDRYIDSTTAYQGHGRGFDFELINRLHQIATTGRFPDLTFLLDLEIDDVLRRGQMRLDSLFLQDRIELESRRFHENVRRGYLQIAEQDRDRIKVINGANDREMVHEEIWSYIINAVEELR